VGQNLANPQSLNRYTYCLNNPLNSNDPTGHWPNWGAIWNGFIVRLSDIFLHPREWVAETATNSLLAPTGVSVDYTPSLVDVSGAPLPYRMAYEYGSTLADATVQTAAAVGIYNAVTRPSINPQSMTGYRYVSESEAKNIVKDGFEIPNTYEDGTPKTIYFTDQKYSDVSTVENNLKVGTQDPRGPQLTPGYGVSFKIQYGDYQSSGLTDGGFHQFQTTYTDLPPIVVPPLMLVPWLT